MAGSIARARLLAAHDDIDVDNGNLLSLLEGEVPANGMLTFAVTGYGDDGFVGVHDEIGTYGLVLEADVAGLDGDYNHDGSVDAADYVVWRKELGSPEAYNLWCAHFGEPGGGSGAIALDSSGVDSSPVPEPTSLFLCCIAAIVGVALTPRVAR